MRGDLDAILMKALRKEPEGRYRSVELLAADLGRWLDGLPVLARRGSRAYAARKFAARQRGAVTAALLLVALLIGYALDRQSRLVEVQRQRVIGLSPRKQNLTVYIMLGFEEFGPLLKKLGPHKTGKSCLYIKRLADIDQPTLKKLVVSSIAKMKKKHKPTAKA